MSKIKVRYFASLRELLGNIREEEYEVKKGVMLIDLLLSYIPSRHRNVSRSWKQRMFESVNGEIRLDKYGLPIPREYYKILINRRYFNLTSKDSLKHELKNGDVVDVLPPVGGG
jgi:molybdopterin converting factor small subunit